MFAKAAVGLVALVIVAAGLVAGPSAQAAVDNTGQRDPSFSPPALNKWVNSVAVLPAGTEGCCPGLLTAPLDECEAADLARVFKALGDPVRVGLLSMIASGAAGEGCVCDLTPAFELSQPTISHHLKQLSEAELIDSGRRGTWVYYRLLPEATDRLATILTRPAQLVVAVGVGPTL